MITSKEIRTSPLGYGQLLFMWWVWPNALRSAVCPVVGVKSVLQVVEA